MLQTDAFTINTHPILLQNVASSSPAACDLIVTAAAADCVKMWDIRSDRFNSPITITIRLNSSYEIPSIRCRCVQRFEAHANQAHACGVDVSPCGRFMAAASEDRSVSEHYVL